VSELTLIRKRATSQEGIVAILTLVLFGCFSASVPGFLTRDNLIGLLQAVTTLGLLGLGMAIVVIARGIDLSMIAIMSCPTAFILDMVAHGRNISVAFAFGLCLTLLFALINGLLIAYAELPALFVTLSTGLALYGIATTFLSNDIVEWPARLDGFSWIGRAHVAGIPMPMLVLAALIALCALFLGKTRTGRFIYALGDNPQSAKALGVPTRSITIFIYLLSALIAFATGLIMSAVLHASAVRIYNSTLLYEVILVVVLGGIGLSGGRGGTMSVILGTLLIGTITNAMTMMNASYSTQSLVKGGLLLAAVVIDSRINPRNEETAQPGDI
jgi:ribose transport system permease protein